MPSRPLTAKCKQCGGTIAFRKLGAFKWVPTEPNGDDHFSICAARRFEQARTKGTYFEGRRMDDQIVSGYMHKGRAVLTSSASVKGSIVGKDYKPLECAQPCGLPPWERCACSFPEKA